MLLGPPTSIFLHSGDSFSGAAAQLGGNFEASPCELGHQDPHAVTPVPSSDRGAQLSLGPCRPLLAQQPFFWPGTSYVLLEWLVAGGRGSVSPTALTGHCWAPEVGGWGADGCGRKESARNLEPRKRGERKAASREEAPGQSVSSGLALEWNKARAVEKA